MPNLDQLELGCSRALSGDANGQVIQISGAPGLQGCPGAVARIHSHQLELAWMPIHSFQAWRRDALHQIGATQAEGHRRVSLERFAEEEPAILTHIPNKAKIGRAECVRHHLAGFGGKE